MTTLIVFLQQMTAFVETKDREIEGRMIRRFEALAPYLDSLAELRTQMTVLHRTTQLLTRQLAESAPPASDVRAPDERVSHPPSDSLASAAYVGFEDEFRGSEASIRQRLSEYVPLFAGTADVVDLGCGRGEFLRLLREQGIRARGVDTNGEMVAAARTHDLDAVCGDALSFLTSVPEESVGGLFASQVIEHLEPAYLIQLLAAARRGLKPGAPIVLETINPACWLAFFSSYLRDPTHVRPVHPETLQYLLRAHGFERVSLRYSAPVPDQVKMRNAHLPADVIASAGPAEQALVETARVVNENAAILNSLLFTYQDYAAMGYRI
jgi:O-antigen chain-terminating methyltransferase